MRKDRLIEKAKKLQALAERGEGGEKVTAEKMLNKFLEKHGISFDDLESDEIIEREFKWKDELQRKLLFQLSVAVFSKELKAYTLRNRRKCILLEGELSKVLELEFLYSIYCDALVSFLDEAMLAFFYANDIFDKSTSDEKGELSHEEAAHHKRAGMMSLFICKTDKNRLLEQKEEG